MPAGLAEGIGPELLALGLLVVSGVFFWVSLLLAPDTLRILSNGWRWLEWRPLPHHLALYMFWGFLAGFVLQQLFVAGLQILNLTDRVPLGVVILFSIVFFQGLMSLVLYAGIHRGRLNPLEVLGMENPFRFSDLIWGLVAFCMCLPLVGLSTVLTQWIFETMQWEIEAQSMVKMFSELTGWMNWISLFLLVGFIGPLLEEVVFRGFLFTWLHQQTGMVSGLFLQALIFSLIHMHVPSMLPLFFLSLLLGLVYVYTRRLMACVWTHALFNTLTLIHTFFFSGGEPGL